MEFLVLRLYAPLASWGTLAVGEDRPTLSHPTRGAILGLLAAALGIRRHEQTRLDDLALSVQIGTKTYSEGTILRDYHTIQTPPTKKKGQYATRKQELANKNHELNTILSSRDYREDGLWVVAIWLSSDASYRLEALQQALCQPVFTLYLGRKSCPLALPVSATIVTTDNLKQALDYDFAQPLSQVVTNDNNKLPSGKRFSNIKFYPLVTQTYSERWLPVQKVYDYQLIQSTADTPATAMTGIRVNYHWEGNISFLATRSILSKQGQSDDESDELLDYAQQVHTYQYWDEPTNREQWQFTQRTGHTWTTIEPMLQSN